MVVSRARIAATGRFDSVSKCYLNRSYLHPYLLRLKVKYLTKLACNELTVVHRQNPVNKHSEPRAQVAIAGVHHPEQQLACIEVG